MRQYVPRNLFIALSGLILFLISCGPESCFEETNAFVKVTFCLNSTGKAVAPDSLTLYGINMDQYKIYNKSLKVSSALIPLNSETDKSTFIIRINGISDTLEFSYTSYPHLLSKECGYTFYHTLDTDPVFTKNAIVKMNIDKRTITTINEENIRIFY
jgi:hypothetical protein